MEPCKRRLGQVRYHHSRRDKDGIAALSTHGTGRQDDVVTSPQCGQLSNSSLGNPCMAGLLRRDPAEQRLFVGRAGRYLPENN